MQIPDKVKGFPGGHIPMFHLPFPALTKCNPPVVWKLVTNHYTLVLDYIENFFENPTADRQA